MRILVVSRTYPAPDRNSGDLRFIRLIALLRGQADIFFCATAIDWQVSEVGAASVGRYRAQLLALGVVIAEGTVPGALRERPFDAVLFEFYDVAAKYLGFARCLQPNCKVVVDIVDLHYERLLRAAELSQDPWDIELAHRVRELEIATYAGADLLIAINEVEAEKLRAQRIPAEITVVTNIHPLHLFSEKPAASRKRLLFVGGFTHAPNEDGIVNFCEEVLPIVLDACPEVRLQIVGNAPTERVRALACANVEVIGHVPEIEPYLQANGISIAPLRFGAGLKGKVGEALAAGLVVVTTSIGSEGFGFKSGIHAAVSDTATDMASDIIGLIADAGRYEAMRIAGWRFFEEHFGSAVICRQVAITLERIEGISPRSLSFTEWTRHRLSLAHFDIARGYHRRFAWRFST